MKITRTAILVTAAMALAIPSAASAQDTLNRTTDRTVTTTTPVVDEDHDDFPWGLLGLLGLAGLLGRKRRDDDVNINRTTNSDRPVR